MRSPEFGGNVIDELPGEVGIGHIGIIGQCVQQVKPKVSKDFGTDVPQYRGMTISREQEFNEKLCARVHRLRNERGWTAQQMATALGVPPDRYRKYEYRSPLPHYLIEQFAVIVGRDVEYVLTGNRAPMRLQGEEQQKKRA